MRRGNRPARNAADPACQCRHRPCRARPAALCRLACAICRGGFLLLPRRPPAQADRGAGGGVGPFARLGAAALRLDFVVATGIMHVPQPPETVAALSSALAPANPFQLALSPIVTIGGSLITALALFDRRSTPTPPGRRSASTSAGRSTNGAIDAEAVAALANRHGASAAAARFLELLDFSRRHQVADEGHQPRLARPLEPLGGDDRFDLGEAIVRSRH